MFSSRFRKHAFGWRGSRPAILRLKEAIAEIKKASKKNGVLGGEGAILLLEKLSPALAQVDSSSGAIGTAVNHAIDEMVKIIAKAAVADDIRNHWLERLWRAIEEDNIPYLDLLPAYWGDLCVTPRLASAWADEFIGTVRLAWSPDPALRGFFKGTTACLSALYTAGRYDEILNLLQNAPFKSWHYYQWGVKALVAEGRKAEALRYAEVSTGLNDNRGTIAEFCEEILLSSGMAEEGYQRYAIQANQRMTYLATFQAIVRKYPHKEKRDVLRDLVESTPGQEGKWFASAKWAGLYDEAIRLANLSPCDPRTLIRAAQDTAVELPGFAIEAGMAALRWLAEGYGYEVTSVDVIDAYAHTVKAAEKAGSKPKTLKRIKELLVTERGDGGFVAKILCPRLAEAMRE
jgi:tetratricopeptide (TPR) repeat protein